MHLTVARKLSRSACTIALCALKFLFEQTLQRAWPLFALVRPPQEKTLPVVLSKEEVRRLLGCVEREVFRVYFTTVYACGLRLSEAAQLQVRDVDAGRGLLHVRGKGQKERYVPLPTPLLP